MRGISGITRTQDMRDLESIVSRWADQARLDKYVSDGTQR